MPALKFILSQKTSLSPLYKMTHPEQAKMYKEILTFDGGIGFASADEITVQKKDGTVFRSPLRYYESDFLTETYIGRFPNGEEFRFLFASQTNPMAAIDPMVTFGSMSTSGWAIHFKVRP